MTPDLRAWLELCRVSNLPTVWSNTLHGFAAGLYVAVVSHPAYPQTGDAPTGAGFYLNHGFMLLLAMSLLYAGGMVLNDACDAPADAAERPGRPIPSARVSRGAAFVVGAVMLAAGVSATAVYACVVVPVLASALAACIVAYNLSHRVKLLGYLLMPVCRAMVILTAASAFPGGIGTPAWSLHVALPAVALAVYTAALTRVAWSEVAGGPARRRVVMGLIAAMPLLDAGFLIGMGQVPLALLCVGCAVLTAAGQRFILGT